MNKLRRLKLMAVATMVGLFLAAGCSPIADDVNSQISESLGMPLVIDNVGDSSLEGHTPIGFEGSGTGLFAGDNLNANFPEGDGVQIFLAFPLPNDLPDNLSDGPSGNLSEEAVATLGSSHATLRGTPFEDLAVLRASPVRFDDFGPDVFSIEWIGDATPCSTAGASSPFAISCDVTEALRGAVADGRDHLQLRLRFDTPGDGDGVQDMVLFFISDSNTNEPGIFTLTLE